MKFAIQRLEDRIAPSRVAVPTQQAIVVGGGKGSKAGPSLIMAQQGAGGGFGFGGSPIQQATVVGGGSGSKGGPTLIQAQQGGFGGFGFGGGPTQQAIVATAGSGSKAGPTLIMASQTLPSAPSGHGCNPPPCSPPPCGC